MKNLVAGLACVALFSCDPNESAPRRFDQEYFPLQKGNYQIHDVEEIIYTLSDPDTFRYEVKTLVADSFLNGEGTYTYALHRSKRTPPSTAWVPLETWSARMNSREVVRSEGNVPFVILTFPLVKGGRWDGNALNNLVNPNTNTTLDLFEVTETRSSFDLNGIPYPDCVIVTQEDNQEFIVYQDKRIEVFARHKGLIYKETTQLKYCNDQDRNCIGQQMVDEGVIYKSSLKEDGKE